MCGGASGHWHERVVLGRSPSEHPVVGVRERPQQGPFLAPGHRRERAALVGAPPSGQGGRGQRVGRKVVTAVLPLACHLTMALYFHGSRVSSTLSGCGFPHSYPLRLSPRNQEQSSPWACSPNPSFQHPAPVCTGDTRLRLGHGLSV